MTALEKDPLLRKAGEVTPGVESEAGVGVGEKVPTVLSESAKKELLKEAVIEAGKRIELGQPLPKELGSTAKEINTGPGEEVRPPHTEVTTKELLMKFLNGDFDASESSRLQELVNKAREQAERDKN